MKCGWVLVAALSLISSNLRADELDFQQWIHEKFSECCDHKDCHELLSTQVTPVENGWIIFWQGTQQFVAEQNVKPSRNDKFWFCHYPNSPMPRCFGRPRMGI